jgi:hypothetical protein
MLHMDTQYCNCIGLQVAIYVFEAVLHFPRKEFLPPTRSAC